MKTQIRPAVTPWPSIAALVLSAAALSLSCYQGCTTRENYRLLVTPRAEADFRWPSPDLAGVYVENRGIGPAEIGHVAVALDGTPQYHWREILTAAGVVTGDASFSILRAGTLLPAGTTRALIEVKGLSAQIALRKAFERLRIQVCYCSIYHDCWQSELPSYSRKTVAACERPIHEVDE